MRSRVQPIVIPSEVADCADEVHRVFLELGRRLGDESLAGQCSPSMDVFETDDALEVVVDLPGTDASAIRVLAKGNTLLLVGEKMVQRSKGDSTFHLVERGCGMFARAVRLGHACDTANVRATLTNGELRISIPKISDRRGRAIQIPVKSGRERQELS